MSSPMTCNSKYDPISEGISFGDTDTLGSCRGLSACENHQATEVT